MTYKFQVMDENNENIFASIIEAYKGIIYKIARSYCSVEDDRKDLIQEILLQLWKSFAKYDPQFRYSTWVYRIALNVAISFYRKEKAEEIFLMFTQMRFLKWKIIPLRIKKKICYCCNNL